MTMRCQEISRAGDGDESNVQLSATWCSDRQAEHRLIYSRQEFPRPHHQIGHGRLPWRPEVSPRAACRSFATR